MITPQTLVAERRCAGRIALGGQGVDAADHLDRQGVGGQQEIARVAKDARLGQRVGWSKAPALRVSAKLRPRKVAGEVGVESEAGLEREPMEQRLSGRRIGDARAASLLAGGCKHVAHPG